MFQVFAGLDIYNRFIGITNTLGLECATMWESQGVQMYNNSTTVQTDI